MDATNLDFFLAHAQPGMIGIIGAEASWRIMPSLIRALGGWLIKGGKDSHWSHVFLVLDRAIDEHGADVITIVESTVIGPLQRTEHYMAHPGFPRWNGVQLSRLAIARPDGDVEGQPDRLTVRRYSNDEHTPNVCLIDLGLSDAQWQGVARKCRDIMADDSIDYGSLELVGTFWSTLVGRLDDRNALDSEDLYCTAFLRACLDDVVPALGNLEVHPSNTWPEHMYGALVSAGYPVREIVRSTSIPVLHRIPCRIACELLDEFGWTEPAPSET